MLRGLIGPGNCTNDRNGGKDGSIKIELYHLADDPLKLGTWPLSIPTDFFWGACKPN